MNITYLTVLFSVGFIVLSIKNRGDLKILNLIGWGDVMLLISFSGWFDILGFVVFNSISLLIAMLLHFALKNYSFYDKTRTGTVPLAGIQSLCFFPVFVYSVYFHGYGY